MSLPTPHRHTLQTTLAPMFGFLAAGSVAPTVWADARIPGAGRTLTASVDYEF
jgi:hypothetical protein